MSLTLVAQTIAHLAATQLGVADVCVAGIALLMAGCLLVGFLTPIVAIVIGLGSILLAFPSVPLPAQYPFETLHTLINVIVLSAVILFLGPGAFSFDARMFGRREIRIPTVSNRIEGM